MHIEPGVVNEAKIILSYATAAGAAGICIKNAVDTLKNSSIAAFATRLFAACESGSPRAQILTLNTTTTTTTTSTTTTTTYYYYHYHYYYYYYYYYYYSYYYFYFYYY